ncbi:hypothetical protein Tco_0225196 [Tanacetum coccineum]
MKAASAAGAAKASISYDWKIAVVVSTRTSVPESTLSLANVVLMNVIALLRLAIGSSVGRNDGITRPDSSCGNLAGDY